jgi:hypothetical protein
VDIESLVPLLIRGNAFLVLDLLLHILNGVRSLNLEGDGLAREGLNEDLHLRDDARTDDAREKEPRRTGGF